LNFRASGLPAKLVGAAVIEISTVPLRHTITPSFPMLTVASSASEGSMFASAEAEVTCTGNVKRFIPGPSNGGQLSVVLDSFLSRHLHEPVNKVPTPWRTSSFSYRCINYVHRSDEVDDSASELSYMSDESDEIIEYGEETIPECEENLYEDSFKVPQLLSEPVKLTRQDEGEILSFLSDVFGFPNQPVVDEPNSTLPSIPPVPTPSFAPQTRRGSPWLHLNCQQPIGEVQNQQGSQAEKQSHECAFSIIKACSLVATISDSAPAEKCSICLESMAIGQRVRVLPCLHRLHECCSGRYFRTAGIKPACPVCRHTA
jgi:hypothetical protein